MQIAIVGAAYTGLAAARHFQGQGHRVSVTTTRAERAGELESVADRVLVMRNGRIATTLTGDRISEENILGAAMLAGEAA